MTLKTGIQESFNKWRKAPVFSELRELRGALQRRLFGPFSRVKPALFLRYFATNLRFPPVRGFMGRGVNGPLPRRPSGVASLREPEKKKGEDIVMWKEIEQLRRATVRELRVKYLELFGQPSRSNHKQFLFRRVAWRLQALA